MTLGAEFRRSQNSQRLGANSGRAKRREFAKVKKGIGLPAQKDNLNTQRNGRIKRTQSLLHRLGSSHRTHRFPATFTPLSPSL